MKDIVMNEQIVTIELFNPYESIKPKRNLVSRDVLILIKTLRAQGIKVVMKPPRDIPIEYLMQKGVSDFLTDPANLFVATVAAM